MSVFGVTSHLGKQISQLLARLYHAFEVYLD